MKVTSLVTQKKNQNRFNLFIDEKFAFSVSANSIAKYHLYNGREIEEVQLLEIYNEEIYRRFLDRAADYISRYVKSERDLLMYLRKLKKNKEGKWFSNDLEMDWEDLFTRVLNQLKKFKYIDDERFARQFIESRVRSKPRSRSVLLSELISKGIHKDTALAALEGSDVNDEDMLLSIYKKKYMDQLLDLQDRKKVDFLRRKGFNWSEISKLAERLKDDA